MVMNANMSELNHIESEHLIEHIYLSGGLGVDLKTDIKKT
jgi:hypothetical protein